MLCVRVSRVRVQHAQKALTLGHQDPLELSEKVRKTRQQWYFYTNRSGCLDLSKACDMTSFTILWSAES